MPQYEWLLRWFFGRSSARVVYSFRPVAKSMITKIVTKIATTMSKTLSTPHISSGIITGGP